jgi:integrase
MRVVILLLATTGIRLGAVARLKIGSLTKIEKYGLYQITVYESTTSEYICFCSPECTRAIDSYLSYRARYGEMLKPEAPLIREQFNTNDLLKIRYPHNNSEYTIAANLRNLLVRSGISTGTHLTETTVFKGERKFVTTNMVRAKLNPEIREMLLGHSIGLSGSYYRPDNSEMVEEYLKAVDQLTINEDACVERLAS